MSFPYQLPDPYTWADLLYLQSQIDGLATGASPNALPLVFNDKMTAACGFSFSRSLTTINPSSEMVRFALGMPWVLSGGLSYPPSVGNVGGSPTSLTQFTINQNGNPIGTMQFGAGQTSAQFSLAQPLVALLGTDIISVTSPSVLNGMSGILSFTILGYRFAGPYDR